MQREELTNPFALGEKVSYRGQEATVVNNDRPRSVTLRLWANHFKTVMISDVDIVRHTGK